MSNLLNTVNRSKSFSYRSGNVIPQAFRGQISSYRRPFTYTDPNGERVDVLVVKLNSAKALDGARTMQRNFIGHYIAKLDHDETVDAVLAAFYHEDVADWRFSLVRLEYIFGDEGADQKLTPARRYSFLVGPTEPTHTAERQLRPFLLQDDANPTIDDLVRAFQIEVVSKRFFEEYTELFHDLVEAIELQLTQSATLAADFRRSEILVPNFAKKLLGQIVFLYFVQKKGWMGVESGGNWGTGPKDFLRRLFDKAHGVTYANFFNDVLESLFYDALAVDRGGGRFSLNGYTCQIPFLNGGLFEPMGGYDWRNTNLLLPNALFSNRKNADDDGGTGILDVFDRYNFTVWEEEPLEKEVAVDPEMLGKVFENLLEVKDRKSKGAFYTPREIVHYMCQESLINYLDTAVNGGGETAKVPREEIAVLVRQGALALQQDTAKEAGLQRGEHVLPESVRKHAQELDDALADIKLCDPAIGSGAFPVGMLHEIVQARQALDTQLKRGISAYQLKRHAIQQSIYGVDIDSGAVEIAKLRLWLSLVVDEESYANIQPLPNLDYKIVCGNSLLGVDVKKVDLFTNDLYVRLEELKQRFFDATHRNNKLRLQAQIDLLLEQLTGSRHTFDFKIHFHEVFARQQGFDIMIGNPPYVRQELIKEFKPQFKARFKQVYAGTADLYVYFYAQAIEMLRPMGNLAYITSNKFMRAGYGKNLRGFLTTQTALHALIDFGDLPVFEATAYPAIVIIQKREPHPDEEIQALSVESLDILKRLPQEINALAWELPQRSLPIDGWTIAQSDVRELMVKLRRSGQPLEKYVDGKFFRGVVTGLDEAFVINEDIRNKLIQSDVRSTDLIKPWLRGKDVQKWRVDWHNLYVIFARRGVNIDRYPAIKEYLEQYRQQLTPKPPNWDTDKKWLGRKAGPYEWYEVQDSTSYYEELDKPKIIYQKFQVEPKFSFDRSGAYVNSAVWMLITDDLALLAVLNSKLGWFLITQYCTKIQNGYQLIWEYFKRIPIANSITKLGGRLEKLVHKLVNEVESQGTDTIHLEAELNHLIYQLYDLTPQEVELIEEQIDLDSRKKTMESAQEALNQLKSLRVQE